MALSSLAKRFVETSIYKLAPLGPITANPPSKNHTSEKTLKTAKINTCIYIICICLYKLGLIRLNMCADL